MITQEQWDATPAAPDDATPPYITVAFDAIQSQRSFDVSFLAFDERSQILTSAENAWHTDGPDAAGLAAVAAFDTVTHNAYLN